MEAICIKFEEKFLHDLEETMKRHRYVTKTEFIREAVRDKIRDLEKEEALLKVKHIYGASHRKTKGIPKAREKAFGEIERELT